jgi:hypothetical protein
MSGIQIVGEVNEWMDDLKKIFLKPKNTRNENEMDIVIDFFKFFFLFTKF